MKNYRVFLMAVAAISVCVLGSMAPSAHGGKAPPDLPVTSTIADVNANNVAYWVQNDNAGAYENGVSGVQSILQSGTNDWVLATYNSDFTGSSGRYADITLTSANEVQPGDPNFTAPANPPFTGTRLQPVRFITECSFAPFYVNIRLIKPGTPAYCPLDLRFGADIGKGGNASFYRFQMGGQYPIQAETQTVQISCNAVDSSGNCNSWSIDSIPPASQGGGTQVRARLNLVTGGSTLTNEGDFYLTFHISVTNP